MEHQGGGGHTHLSACCAEPEPAGFRLLNAFSHFVFIDGAVAAENLRSLRGEVGSTLLTNNSFCKWKREIKLERVGR